MRQDREQREHQAEVVAEMQAEAERRTEAAEWFRSVGRWSGGGPQPAAETLKAAKAAGIEASALEAATTRVRRLSDGVECLAVTGQYLRRDYREIEPEPIPAA